MNSNFRRPTRAAVGYLFRGNSLMNRFPKTAKATFPREFPRIPTPAEVINARYKTTAELGRFVFLQPFVTSLRLNESLARVNREQFAR